MKLLLRRLFAALAAALMLGSCITNDIPYPVVELEIVALEGDGFTVAPTAIDRSARTVTLTLREQTDIRRVKINSVTLNEPAAKTDVELTEGRFDMRTPLEVTLSLYQEYLWTLFAEQQITRSFSVEGQVGATEWDLKNHIARAYVPEGTDMNNIKVTSLKLGPAEITSMTPSAEGLTSFESVRYVDITYHGDIEERWYLYVIPTEVTVELQTADAWSRVIWLKAMGDSAKEVGFRYRPAGSEEWLEVPDVQIDGGIFSARLVVEPESGYDVLAYCGEDTTPIRTVTTEGEAQLPNAGLESWCTIKDIIYPYAESDEPFWGTGNVGASVAGAVLTDKSTDIRPGSSGSYSARLESLFANVAGIGKFAAGNLYTGTYVKNVGTNGIITFGRPFTLRPTALRLWMKYNCGAIDKIKGSPAGTNLQAGDPDKGSIYIALGTWTKEEYGITQEKDGPRTYGTDSSPICIDTRNEATFFNPKSKDVVGYGELVMDYSTPEWTQVTIPIEYVATDIRPTHIIVVCTGSRYGDYFTGSTESLMYIDDIELLYY